MAPWLIFDNGLLLYSCGSNDECTNTNKCPLYFYLGNMKFLRLVSDVLTKQDITPLITWRREVWKEKVLVFLERREWAIISQTSIQTVSKAASGKLLRDGVECIMGFSKWIDAT